MPEISVIVPVYKVEEYLSECVDSILAQSFTDFECILVDDGSPDRCGAICDEYAVKDSRIHVIHQQNGGLSAARNSGIEWVVNNSGSNWICFVDSDDVVSPQYLAVLYRSANKSGCMLSSCGVERFSDRPSYKDQIREDWENCIERLSFSEYLRCQMSGVFAMGVCNRLYSREVFNSVRFHMGMTHEDIVFAGDLLKVDNLSVACVDTPLYFYRQRASSIMQSQVSSGKCSPDRVTAAEYLLKCAKEVNYEFISQCLFYALKYPWYFVDPVYVDFKLKENKEFLNELQRFIAENRDEIQELSQISKIERKRMLLFARSKFAYGLNAYARLLRVYLYHIIKKDPYKDGHGI